MDARLQQILEDLRTRLDKHYGPRLVRVVLCGSQARGDARPDSDIDVLVVLEGAVNPGREIAATEFDVADVCLKYAAVIACMFVSREQFEMEQSPVLMTARAEGVAV